MSAVYIAAAYGEASRAEAVARTIRDQGLLVVSTWHANPSPAGDAGLDSVGRRTVAGQCLSEVDAADVVVVLPSPRARGAYFEAGYAHARRKRLVWVVDDGPVFDAVADLRPLTDDAIDMAGVQ